MVAGGGASVIYADTVGDLGFAEELGNYAEYSGAPNTQASAAVQTQPLAADAAALTCTGTCAGQPSAHRQPAAVELCGRRCRKTLMSSIMRKTAPVPSIANRRRHRACHAAPSGTGCMLT